MIYLLIATVCALIGFALGWWVRNDAQSDPEDVAEMTLFDIQTWLAEWADLPVSQASHALRILRGRPDILRRLETIPVKLSPEAEDLLP